MKSVLPPIIQTPRGNRAWQETYATRDSDKVKDNENMSKTADTSTHVNNGTNIVINKVQTAGKDQVVVDTRGKSNDVGVAEESKPKPGIIRRNAKGCLESVPCRSKPITSKCPPLFRKRS